MLAVHAWAADGADAEAKAATACGDGNLFCLTPGSRAVLLAGSRRDAWKAGWAGRK